MADRYGILFGDIHNHYACGYGIGSMERTIDIAQSRLDFFAFTGHSSWHDMEPMEGGREVHWLKGFARLEEQWPNVQQLIADADRDGKFNAFLGFEWHSSRYGDQCVVFPDDHQPVYYARDVPDLRAFCREKNALMIPHHPGGRIGGHVLARNGRRATQIGPLVAEDLATAEALFAAALAHAAGPAFIDLNDRHTDLRGWLDRRGFTVQRPFTRMLLGRAEPLDAPPRIIAVAGPELG